MLRAMRWAQGSGRGAREGLGRARAGRAVGGADDSRLGRRGWRWTGSRCAFRWAARAERTGRGTRPCRRPRSVMLEPFVCAPDLASGLHFLMQARVRLTDALEASRTSARIDLRTLKNARLALAARFRRPRLAARSSLDDHSHPARPGSARLRWNAARLASLDLQPSPGSRSSHLRHLVVITAALSTCPPAQLGDRDLGRRLALAAGSGPSSRSVLWHVCTRSRRHCLRAPGSGGANGPAASRFNARSRGPRSLAHALLYRPLHSYDGLALRRTPTYSCRSGCASFYVSSPTCRQPHRASQPRSSHQSSSTSPSSSSRSASSPSSASASSSCVPSSRSPFSRERRAHL